MFGDARRLQADFTAGDAAAQLDRRLVELQRGEALFEVAHDPKRPFEVTANRVTSRAVGTKFSVRLYEDERVETVVAEGRVLVLRERSFMGIPTTKSPAARPL